MTRIFKTSDFDYELPKELIAQYPLAERSASRLFQVDPQNSSRNHSYFSKLTELLTEKDVLIFNDTKVIPARLQGYKASGGRVECFIERVLSEQRALAQIRASKSPRVGSRMRLADAFEVRVVGRQSDLFELEFDSQQTVLELLHAHGQVPLPPYIQRAPEHSDQGRYQTVFAKKEGAVAAPTAGLHFDEALLQALAEKGIASAYVTLHVGAGTFQPVRVESLDEHHMHREFVEVSPEVCEAIEACKQRGGRVIAVGTTVVRCLETAAKEGSLRPFYGDTDLFIYPGYQFRCVDALVTNFHLPRSSLLMLVCAFGGYERVMDAYREAIEERYRFFSYGDAMLLV